MLIVTGSTGESQRDSLANESLTRLVGTLSPSSPNEPRWTLVGQRVANETGWDSYRVANETRWDSLANESQIRTHAHAESGRANDTDGMREWPSTPSTGPEFGVFFSASGVTSACIYPAPARTPARTPVRKCPPQSGGVGPLRGPDDCWEGGGGRDGARARARPLFKLGRADGGSNSICCENENGNGTSAACGGGARSPLPPLWEEEMKFLGSGSPHSHHQCPRPLALWSVFFYPDVLEVWRKNARHSGAQIVVRCRHTIIWRRCS
eukprot:gene8792-biopygen119